MSLKLAAARAVGSLSTWGLKNIFHRPAANLPGKIALQIDSHLIGDLRYKLGKGSIVVVGTNGKTTVTNLLADVLERAGNSVVCNRTGANLASGVASALLQAEEADWGVIESDELWLAHVLPELQADYVVLLNLFRDQLDRMGEIDRIQDSIVDALISSPRTVLVYNADDPLCATIAVRAAQAPARQNVRSISFGTTESMGLEQNTVADATMCQHCSSMFEYAYRQYGQLGEYACPTCGFKRPDLDFGVSGVKLGANDLSFALADAQGDFVQEISAPFSGSYMVYNLASVGVAAKLVGCSQESVQNAITHFDPQNGRLQSYVIGGRFTLLNLAKNPTGFNQNIKIVLQDEKPKAVAFFVNDREADGHDISWLWDIDFEELASEQDLLVFVGGIRKYDLKVRFKYAGIDAQCIDDATDMFRYLENRSAEVSAYLIANYTALAPVKAELDGLAEGGVVVGESKSITAQGILSGEGALPCANEAPVVIAHLFPDLLNLYGDGGNVRILEHRLSSRGIPCDVQKVHYGESIDLSKVDLVFLGGGPDREQRLASVEVLRMRDELRAYVEEDGVLLAICGGYQILGHEWLLGEESVEGLGIVDITTKRVDASAPRLIENIVLRSSVAKHPVVGYENHAGRTYLGEGVQPFGAVISSVGHGNNDTDKQDGVRYRNVVGTYSHGPLLAKNPEIADDLLRRALDHRRSRVGVKATALAPLDDSAVNEANEFMCKKLGVNLPS